MKLELFQFINDAVDELNEQYEKIAEASSHIEKFFLDSFSRNEHFSSITYRIKSPESLKEKILRNNFYTKYRTTEVLFENLKDLIGVRIQCRFTEEERMLYEDVVKLFNVELSDGYFTNSLNPHIEMNMGMPQPVTLKNGFPCYKIDGRYRMKDGEVYNFELQITSLVNVFWSEIEHRILYKNFNYVTSERFYREMMSSIKENLTMIDRQLQLVSNHLAGAKKERPTDTRAHLKSMLSKIIHDQFLLRVHQETGLMLDIRYPSDLVIDYLFFMGRDDEKNMGQQAIEYLNRFSELGKSELDFTSSIEIPRWEPFQNEDTEALANLIYEAVNKDYKWNLFFRILFSLRDGKPEDEFKNVVYFIYQTWTFRILAGMRLAPISEKDKSELMKRFFSVIFTHWSEESDIDFLNVGTMRQIERKVASFMERVERPEDLWELDFEEFYHLLEEGL